MASRGLAGTLVPFRHSADAAPFPIWRTAWFAAARSNGSTARIAAGHKSGQSTDFAPIVARSWLPIREPETGM
jgi:hypothetical protein